MVLVKSRHSGIGEADDDIKRPSIDDFDRLSLRNPVKLYITVND